MLNSASKFLLSARLAATTMGSKVAAPAHPKRRFFSSMFPSGLRAFPQYGVFGEKAMMTIKIMFPALKKLPSNVVVVDKNKKGRILIEMIPRAADGSLNFDSNLRFALSPEEVGLILDQIPQFPVQLTRRMVTAEGEVTSDGDAPVKALYVTPMEGGAVSFKVDFEQNGVGGQAPAGDGDNTATGPLEVTAQLGEVQVLKELMRYSIPTLIGWSPLVDIAIKGGFDMATSRQSGGAFDSSAGSAPSEGVPF